MTSYFGFVFEENSVREITWLSWRHHLRKAPFSKCFSSALRTCLQLKPWPNGLAGRRKLKAWVYLRRHSARPCVHLRWLAMTCAHFGRDQICTQVKGSFSPFGHPTQVNASWVTSINLLLADEIQGMSALKLVFLLLACTSEETC